MSKTNLIAEPGQHSITMTREFAAPRELVFKALTDPALVAKWWGPKGVNVTIDKMEVRKGGIWRYVERGDDGEYAFSGVYHDITAPERLVYTFEFEGMPGHVLLETITLEERDGKTTITDLSVFQSVEDRDGMIASGMESGANDSWDALEELLKTL